MADRGRRPPGDDDRSRRPFDRGRRPFDRDRRPHDRDRRPHDRDRRPHDRDRRPHDRDRRPLDRDRPTDQSRGRPDEGEAGRRAEREWRPRPGSWSGAGRPVDRERRPWQERPKRAAQPAGDLVAEGEELVAGRRPVEEAFSAGRDARRLLVVPERRAALEALVMHATALRLPLVEVEGGSLTSLTGFDGHQGVALVVAARPEATIDDVLARARERQEPAFLLILDSLEDPQNLGTLLRSAEACGVHGVIFPTRRSAPLTPAAIKASAGATEHLLLLPVDNLAGTMAELRTRGLRLVGADEGAALRYAEADLRGPLALVVGSEERGISGALRRRLDLLVRIPMRGRVASLNAAVAGSVLLFAAAEQRGTPETGEEAGAPAGEAPAPAAPRKQRATRVRPAPAAAEGEGSRAETGAGEDLRPGDGTG